MRLPCRFPILAAAGILVISSSASAQEDPYLWLEEVESERALQWAAVQNERTLERLQSDERFASIYEQNIEILNSSERLPMPQQRGDYIYNFWRDETHVRGIWRRTSYQSYRSDTPDWEVVVDLDALADEEQENWVWEGARCRYPDYDRCLIGLSRGGADAAVVREFDLETKEFVSGGFELAEAKSDYAWRDRDSLFVGTDFGAGSLTSSGYPREVRVWQRGTPVDDAEILFESAFTDVAADGVRMFDGSRHFEIVRQATSFYSANFFWFRNGELARLDIPEDADLEAIVDSHAVIALKSDWRLGETLFPQGALVTADIESLTGNEPVVDTLFEPGPGVSIAGVARIRSGLALNLLDNVVSRLLVIQRTGDAWRHREMEVPGSGSIAIVSTDPDSDRFFFNYTGFLTPPSLYEADAARTTGTRIRSQPAFFDSAGMRVEQLSATSADGTSIPYFVVMPAGFEPNGENPTLLYGYGGFEISETPRYSPTVGAAWLSRGGVYVVANIRGGGEFGPAWHQAALLENRQRAYDDFIAVAEDLIARAITSPRHLGIQGGSNGGLLVGAVFVQRPELFNAVVCQVPLLDMRRYHRLLAGASWMAEYGNPDVPEQWEFISRYSPYQNVSAEADYPEVYFFTSTRDDRVHPAHARKMVARMQEQGHETLYYENIEGGHGGAANLNQSALNQALAYTYLHQRLGTPPE